MMRIIWITREVILSGVIKIVLIYQLQNYLIGILYDICRVGCHSSCFPTVTIPITKTGTISYPYGLKVSGKAFKSGTSYCIFWVILSKLLFCIECLCTHPPPFVTNLFRELHFRINVCIIVVISTLFNHL